MTARTLQAAQTRYQAALKRAAQAEADRDAKIREALEAGWTLRQVAAEVGISFGRVHQIQKGTR